eukprot:SAG22_NODE_11724_length_472_cov_0.675603_1_plen_97_part_10
MQQFYGVAAKMKVDIPRRPPMAAMRQWGTEQSVYSFRTATVAAVAIQRIWRGRSGMKTFETTWNRSHEAALTIQTAYRARLLAKWLARERQVVLTKS